MKGNCSFLHYLHLSDGLRAVVMFVAGRTHIYLVVFGGYADQFQGNVGALPYISSHLTFLMLAIVPLGNMTKASIYVTGPTANALICARSPRKRHLPSVQRKSSMLSHMKNRSSLTVSIGC